MSLVVVVVVVAAVAAHLEPSNNRFPCSNLGTHLHYIFEERSDGACFHEPWIYGRGCVFQLQRVFFWIWGTQFLTYDSGNGPKIMYAF